MNESNKNIDETEMTNTEVDRSNKLNVLSPTYLQGTVPIFDFGDISSIDEFFRIENKISENLWFLDQRQRATESTTTDWMMNFEKRLGTLERQYNKEMNEDKELIRKNSITLSEIGQFQDNWNQYGAKKFSQELIFKCLQIVSSAELKFQPDIFPTGRQSIQLEYEPDVNNYFEIEVFDNNIKMYHRSFDKKIKMENLSIEDTIRELNAFQSRYQNS